MGVAILGNEAYHLVLGFLFSLSSLGFGSCLLLLLSLGFFFERRFRISFGFSSLLVRVLIVLGFFYSLFWIMVLGFLSLPTSCHG